MKLLLLLVLVFPAHAKKKKTPTEQPVVPEKPMIVVDLEPEGPTPGSLWNEVPARRVMGLDNNARQVGDLVTVRVTEKTATSLDASTSTSKDSSNEHAINALFGIETTLTNAMPNMGGEIKIS